MTSIAFHVHGTPAPQGSKRHVGHGVMVESSKLVKPWREAVKFAALEVRPAEPIDGPVAVCLAFTLAAPASAPKRRLAMGPCRKPDIDKLVRSTLDAIVDAGLIVDDARVVGLHATKRYGQPGCTVRVVEVAE